MAEDSRTTVHFLEYFSTRAIPLDRSSSAHPVLTPPFLGPLLFPNESSDARDHCANERTFLSWLRLSVYMAVVSAAIMISFHLKSQPTAVERRLALPVGLLFWILSVACLGNGLANYIKTVKKYGRRQALVQSGWKTQIWLAQSLQSVYYYSRQMLRGNAEETVQQDPNLMKAQYIMADKSMSCG